MAEEGYLFESIFGEAWNHLPPVMKKHYAVRAGSADIVTVEGIMQLERSWLARLLSPMLRLSGALVPYSGNDISVTVRFTSPPGTRSFIFDRVFNVPGHTPYRFRSRMEPVNANEMVEFMRFGFGWHARYEWDGQRVWLRHKGYVWRIFGKMLPAPIGWILGSGDAWEEPIDDNSFRMRMDVVHPLFGKTYGYGGTFRVTEVLNG